MSTDIPAIEAKGLGRRYSDGSQTLRAVDGVSFTVAVGEVVAVVGPSGSGKTTLLHLLGGLDRPDAGSVRLVGVDWQELSGNERSRFRREVCGFVVQGSSLLPQATAEENVEVPLLLAGVNPEVRRSRVAAILERVELSAEAGKLPDELSGGQQQRVAIARALVNQPTVVLADEPTGSLDSVSAEIVVQLLLDAAQERGACVVLVTHDPAAAGHADRLIALHSGRIDAAAPAGSP
ncbi:MAG TPA: ABC transporter ATP-binding protein [Candidatus Limnocylindria bacterium]|jgi:ABC-type lipoprotein export system ATPase subunit